MTSQCVHYWIIAAPDGSKVSQGKCKKCGEVKEFKNWLEIYPFTRNEKEVKKPEIIKQQIIDKTEDDLL